MESLGRCLPVGALAGPLGGAPVAVGHQALCVGCPALAVIFAFMASTSSGVCPGAALGPLASPEDGVLQASGMGLLGKVGWYR